MNFKIARFLIYLLLFFTVGCSDNKNKMFIVKGKVINGHLSKISLVTFDDTTHTTVVLDTCTIDNNGNFSLTAFNKEEALYALQLGGFEDIWIVNDVSQLEVIIDYKNYKKYTTKRSPASLQIQQFLSKYDSLQMQIVSSNDSLKVAQKNNVSDSILNIKKLAQKFSIATLKTFCSNQINSDLSPATKQFFLFYSFKSNVINEVEALNFVNTGIADFAKNKQYKLMQNWVQNKASTSPIKLLLDTQMPSFEIATNKGDTVNNATYNGRYLLLDFWASYNKQYREETYSLTQTYKQFKDTNFSILGISLDTNTIAYSRAIKSDSLVWRNAIDTTQFSSKMAKQFFVKSLPFNVLVNPQQKIIGVNIRGALLREKLKEIYKKN